VPIMLLCIFHTSILLSRTVYILVPVLRAMVGYALYRLQGV
jgi:hypothetical protein